MFICRPIIIKKIFCSAFSVLGAVLACLISVNLYADTLYNGSLGSTPSAQGFSYISNPFVGALTTQSLTSTSVVLDSSTLQSEQAGYFGQSTHPYVNQLDSNQGFIVKFKIRLIEEHHANNNRAGFSVLVVSHSLAAIELGFWQNQIWAQNDSPLFTQGESANFNSNTLTHFELAIYLGHYVLSANQQIILTGPLRNYSAFSGFPNVYAQADLLFLGDNSSSADAIVEISTIALEPFESMNIPLHSRYVWLLAALFLSCYIMRRKPSCF